MKLVFLGATRGMGRALARLRAGKGDRIFLLGRRAEELERSLQDLAARSPGAAAGHAFCDLEDPAGFGPALDRADESLGGFDGVVVTAGVFAAQEALEADPDALERLLDVDFAHTILFCEEARKRLLARGGGLLCVFSSVAGDRGRGRVGLYGAAKAGLSHYLESLDHRWRAAGLKTICVKPGFVRTDMTAGLEPPPFAGDADEVARLVSRAMDRGWPVVYAPRSWAAVMFVVRRLPRWLLRRFDF